MLTTDDFRAILRDFGFEPVERRNALWCSPTHEPFCGPHGERAQLYPAAIALLSLSGGSRPDQPGTRPWTTFGGPAPAHTRAHVEQWLRNRKQRAR